MHSATAPLRLTQCPALPRKMSGHAADSISASAPFSDTFNVVAPHQKDTYGHLGTAFLEHWCCLTSAPCVNVS